MSFLCASAPWREIRILDSVRGGLCCFRHRDHNEAILKFKEEKYANLLVLLQGFVGKTANSERKKAFFEEQYRSWLYCSDEVLKAINTLVQLVIMSKGEEPNLEQWRMAVGNIVLAMRKDLLRKTNLKYNDFRYTDVIEDN